MAGIYNTAGTSVIAYGSAAARCTIEQLRNALVWIYFMIFYVNGRRLEKFTILQLVGFVVLFFGILVFNEMIVLPVFQKESRYERAQSPEPDRKQIDGGRANMPMIMVSDLDDGNKTARMGEGSINSNEAPATGQLNETIDIPLDETQE